MRKIIINTPAPWEPLPPEEKEVKDEPVRPEVKRKRVVKKTEEPPKKVEEQGDESQQGG